MKIALLHYSGPPTVGGVEQTLYYHALSLAELGHEPLLILGQGRPFDPRIPICLLPALYSKHPGVLAAKRALDEGRINSAFVQLRRSLLEKLAPRVAGAEVLIVHNALTLHKNLPLSAALWDLLREDRLPRTIGWHHDFAWDRPGYAGELHPGFPWELLRKAWPEVTNVVVSRSQRQRLARLYGVPPEGIHVIPPGVDPARAGHWTALARRLVRELDLMQADAVLLLPARITRRKNIGFAIQVLGEIRRLTDLDVRLLVTGPPGAHNPDNKAYLQELLDLREELGLQESCHLVYQLGRDEPLYIDDHSMANLYAICDALFFPSRVEGFGIPVLEAGLARLPIFCSDIPPFQESVAERAHFFDLGAKPRPVAAMVAEYLFQDPAWVLRRKVLSLYTWDHIVADSVLPLLMGKTDE